MLLCVVCFILLQAQIAVSSVEPYLIYTTRFGIYRMFLNDGGRPIENLVRGGHGYGAVDYHYRMNVLFWINTDFNTLNRAILSDGSSQTVMLTSPNPVDVTVDWINDKLYWVDAGESEIYEYDLITNTTRFILSTGTNQDSYPRRLVIYPYRNNGWLYWTDQKTASLEMGSIHGSVRESIINHLPCVEALTIDYSTHTVYWADICEYNFKSIRIDGDGETLTYQLSRSVHFVSSMGNYNGSLFWVEPSGIYMIGSTGEGYRRVLSAPSNVVPIGVQVVHPSQQPPEEVYLQLILSPDDSTYTCNSSCEMGVCIPPGFCACHKGWMGVWCHEDIDECSAASHQCHQICNNTVGGYNCSCLSGFTLASDSRSCLDIDECETSACQQLCVNYPGSFYCDCISGYTLDNDNQTCTDIDECGNGANNCEQICNNQQGSYDCSCRHGYFLNEDMKTCTRNESIPLLTTSVIIPTSTITPAIPTSSEERLNSSQPITSLLSLTTSFPRSTEYLSQTVTSSLPPRSTDHLSHAVTSSLPFASSPIQNSTASTTVLPFTESLPLTSTSVSGPISLGIRPTYIGLSITATPSSVPLSLGPSVTTPFTSKPMQSQMYSSILSSLSNEITTTPAVSKPMQSLMYSTMLSSLSDAASSSVHLSGGRDMTTMPLGHSSADVYTPVLTTSYVVWPTETYSTILMYHSSLMLTPSVISAMMFDQSTPISATTGLSTIKSMTSSQKLIISSPSFSRSATDSMVTSPSPTKSMSNQELFISSSTSFSRSATDSKIPVVTSLSSTDHTKYSSMPTTSALSSPEMSITNSIPSSSGTTTSSYMTTTTTIVDHPQQSTSRFSQVSITSSGTISSKSPTMNTDSSTDSPTLVPTHCPPLAPRESSITTNSTSATSSIKIKENEPTLWYYENRVALIIVGVGVILVITGVIVMGLLLWYRRYRDTGSWTPNNNVTAGVAGDGSGREVNCSRYSFRFQKRYTVV